jgi:LuxR family maltose regulon positive regulatory protein
MSWKTPLVKEGVLTDLSLAASIPLESTAWRDWLAAEEHCSFHLRDGVGDFTARKEHKQRGGDYWVAYRHVCGKLHKIYLGKSENLTYQNLRTVAQALEQQVAAQLQRVHAQTRAASDDIRSSGPD